MSVAVAALKVRSVQMHKENDHYNSTNKLTYLF